MECPNLPNPVIARKAPEQRWSSFIRKCESPIEQSFVLAFCEQADGEGYRLSQSSLASDSIAVRPQQWIGRYRVDFSILFRFFGSEINLVVECDGHDFHERTRSQAARDKARDRRLTKEGYRVLRFTGSEIHHSADRCAAEVLTIIMDFQTSVILGAARISQK